MLINRDNFEDIVKEVRAVKAVLVAVSKTKPVDTIKELYDLGHRDFGENYVQELVDKQSQLPPDINWHFIGHLQSNKVKYIAPFVHLVHGIDSLKLLKEVNKQAAKNNRIIDVLLQVHIASEETKFGFNEEELNELVNTPNTELSTLNNISIRGLMGMATFTEDMEVVRKEFHYLRSLFKKYEGIQLANFMFDILSMGMSSDYKVALEEGSNMIRVGSLIFGERVYHQ